jgi:hypothetical protein
VATVPSGCPDVEAVPPALGHVHGGVGAGEQQRAVAAVVGAQRDADAGVDVQGHAVQLEGVAQHGAQGAGHVARASGVGAGQQDGELVAAHPGQEIAGPERLLEPRSDEAEQVVADAVPEAVVDLLEPVQVEHEDGAGAVRAAVDGRLELLDEPAAVG